MAVEEKVKVALTLGEPSLSQTHYAIFLVVKLPLSYNAILGRPILYDFEAVISIQYLTTKFPTSENVIQGKQEEARAIYWAMVEEQNA